ncbi:MAG: hypothetical protein ABGX83_11145 [Nitrospira sp.]|nr:hypothetical protein [Candidatus Manganitrophaceae bacterium]HIL34620.1 hypothetical protein [Candidatus Manganitrophaceae bacterium]
MKRQVGRPFMELFWRMAIAVALLIVSSPLLHAQAPGQDFFTNVIQTELRTVGPGDDLPGFNPCGTGGAVAGDGLSCVDAGAAGSALNDGLLSGTNVLGIKDALGNDTPGLFVKLGPGAVTDNMFGKVLKPLDPTKCGANGSIGTSTLDGLGELNCGNVRFEPGTQGQIIPTRGAILTSLMSSTITVDVSLPGAGVPIDAGHTSKMENTFIWDPLGGQACGPVGQVSICSVQTLDDVTTLDSNGRESSVSLVTSWVAGQDVSVLSGTVQNTFSVLPAVTWSSEIKQAEMGGTGGEFVLTTSGSFNYFLGTATLTIPPNQGFQATQHPTGGSFAEAGKLGTSTTFTVIP